MIRERMVLTNTWRCPLCGCVLPWPMVADGVCATRRKDCVVKAS